MDSALSSWVEAASIDWIPRNSNMYPVRVNGSLKTSQSHGDKRCVLVIAGYTPISCSNNSVKGNFYHQPNKPLRYRKSTDTEAHAGDLITKVEKLSTGKLHLGGQHAVGSSNDNAGRS